MLSQYLIVAQNVKCLIMLVTPVKDGRTELEMEMETGDALCNMRDAIPALCHLFNYNCFSRV